MIISENLSNIFGKYSLEKDEVGMSPTEVYKLIGKEENT